MESICNEAWDVLPEDNGKKEMLKSLQKDLSFLKDEVNSVRRDLQNIKSSFKNMEDEMLLVKSMLMSIMENVKNIPRPEEANRFSTRSEKGRIGFLNSPWI